MTLLSRNRKSSDILIRDVVCFGHIRAINTDADSYRRVLTYHCYAMSLNDIVQ